jgi:hypothetical protein
MFLIGADGRSLDPKIGIPGAADNREKPNPTLF